MSELPSYSDKACDGSRNMWCGRLQMWDFGKELEPEMSLVVDSECVRILRVVDWALRSSQLRECRNCI